MTEREEIINSLNACMDVHRSGLWSSGCAFCSYAKQSNPKCFMNLTKDAIALLREQPEQKHGHWKRVEEGFTDMMCSECGELALLDLDRDFVLSKYCPNCGAIMDKEVEQE